MSSNFEAESVSGIGFGELRRNEQPGRAGLVWPQENGAAMAAAPVTAGGEGNSRPSIPPPAPTPQAPPASPPPAALLHSWGYNRSLTPEEIRRSVLDKEHVWQLATRPLQPDDVARLCFRRVQQIAERDSKHDVPKDLCDFADVGEVIFLDENSQPVEFDAVDVVFMKNGRPVKFSRAIVAWESK